MGKIDDRMKEKQLLLKEQADWNARGPKISSVKPTLDNTMFSNSTLPTKAWRIPVETLAAHRNHVDEKGTIDFWYIHAPWANPMWSYYFLGLIHLRPIEGQSQAPIIRRPGATHEIMLYALNGDFEPLADASALRYLTPVNFIGHFIAKSDEDARAITEATVIEICMGHLSPDTDYIRQWIMRFGDFCFKDDYRNAKPGSVEHAIMQGGTVLMTLSEDGKPVGSAIHILPPNPDDKAPDDSEKH